MTLTVDDLRGYSSPYDDWQAGFIEATRKIESFDGDADEFTMLLLEELWQYVTHQLTLFDCLLPALPSFTALLIRRPDLAGTAMWFLGYLLRWPIRQQTLLLVEPVTYSYLQPKEMQPTHTDIVLFDACKAFYTQHRPLLNGSASQPHFDVLFLGELPDSRPKPLGSDTVGLSWLLAGAIQRFKRGESLVLDEGVELESPECRALAAGVQGRSTEDERLFALLLDDVEVEWSPWAGGRLGAIAGLLLVAKSPAGTPQRTRAITSVVECCTVLKQRHADDERDVMWTDHYLLEDVSSLLFRNHLGASEPLELRCLDVDQRAFVDALWSTYAGHTYTLLYAGLAPPGSSPKSIPMMPLLYNL